MTTSGLFSKKNGPMMSPAHNPHRQSSQNDFQCGELQTEGGAC